MMNKEYQCNPVVRYEIFDREQDDYLDGQPYDVDGILKLVYTEEELKEIIKLFPIHKIKIDKVINYIMNSKGMIITPINQIETLVSASNINLYNDTSVEVKLNNKKDTNILYLSPMEIDGKIITHISFMVENTMIHKYFNSSGNVFEPYQFISSEVGMIDLITKELILSGNIVVEYNSKDQIANVKIKEKEYNIIRTMEGIKVFDGNELVLEIKEKIGEDELYKRIKKYYGEPNKEEETLVVNDLINIPLICLNRECDLEYVDMKKVLDGYTSNRNKLCKMKSIFLSDHFSGNIEYKDLIGDIDSIHFSLEQSHEDNFIMIKQSELKDLEKDITAYSAYFKVKDYNGAKIIDAIYLLENN